MLYVFSPFVVVGYACLLFVSCLFYLTQYVLLVGATKLVLFVMCFWVCVFCLCYDFVWLFVCLLSCFGLFFCSLSVCLLIACSFFPLVGVVLLSPNKNGLFVLYVFSSFVVVVYVSLLFVSCLFYVAYYVLLAGV